jgi:hypothetical protein
VLENASRRPSAAAARARLDAKTIAVLENASS